MARLVESVAPEFGEQVQVRKVVTKTMAGALRYRELVKSEKRHIPVPSIILNGKLFFHVTPQAEELRDCLNRIIHSRKSSDNAADSRQEGYENEQGCG